MKPADQEIPKVIPPGTIVRLARFDRNTPDWKIDVGRRFRIGYYRPSDGLDCIWLVNDSGEYEQTTDRKTLLAYFEIDRLSDETDHFGKARRPLRRSAIVISLADMAMQLEIQDLGISMTEALDKVRRGEEVTIADHGHAVAKLVPIEPEERVFGAFKGRAVIAEDFDAPLSRPAL